MTRQTIAVVGSTNPTKLEAVQRVLDRLEGHLGQFLVEGVTVDSGVPPQPHGRQTLQGALTRARGALAIRPEATLSFGIEAGLIELPSAPAGLATGQLLDVQFCVALGRDGVWTVGHGGGFAYPAVILDEVNRGRSVGEAGRILFGRQDIGSQEGMIGLLSHGHLSRVELTEQAVLLALLPRLTPVLYGVPALES